MFFNQPARALIEQRFSSRSYLAKPIAADLRRRLADFLATLTGGPLGTPARFMLIAATEPSPCLPTLLDQAPRLVAQVSLDGLARCSTGAILVALLAAQGADVHALTRTPNKRQFPPGVTAVKGDFQDVDSMRAAMRCQTAQGLIPSVMSDPHARIAELEAELAALRREMQDFTSAVSHDLRAPLRHIVSFAQLVEEDAGPQLPAEVQGFLATISGSAKHLGAMLDGLRELSRVGSLPLAPGPLALRVLVQEVFAELARSYAPRQLALDVDVPDAAVVVDAALLLSCATKARLAARMARNSHGASVMPVPWHQACSSVQDSGAGPMPPWPHMPASLSRAHR